MEYDFFLFHLGDEGSVLAGVVDRVDAQYHVHRVIFVSSVRDFYRDPIDNFPNLVVSTRAEHTTTVRNLTVVFDVYLFNCAGYRTDITIMVLPVYGV